MSFAEYADYDAVGLAALVDKGEVSPAELVEAAIERIERHNPALNAVVYKAYDEAQPAARPMAALSSRTRSATVSTARTRPTAFASGAQSATWSR